MILMFMKLMKLLHHKLFIVFKNLELIKKKLIQEEELLPLDIHLEPLDPDN
jgi:hypothetical protein